ncbi:MAG: hypothetical protein ACOZQL_20140 [Myxococcota bacterium]
MELVLKQLSAVPGVVGALVFDAQGQVLGTSFPPLFDAGVLGQVTQALADDAYFAEWTSGEAASCELRFVEGQVTVRRAEPGWLLVLSTPQLNAQLLNMSVTQAVRRLKASPGPAPSAPPPPMPAPKVKLADRLRALVKASLGAHAAQALELLDGAGDSPDQLAEACADVEKLTRLFIDQKLADDLGRKLKATLAG